MWQVIEAVSFQQTHNKKRKKKHMVWSEENTQQGL